VPIVAVNTFVKLVLVLPVAVCLVIVMMKASSQEAKCPLVEMVKDTGSLR
jgi:ATP/ADP translocase